MVHYKYTDNDDRIKGLSRVVGEPTINSIYFHYMIIIESSSAIKIGPCILQILLTTVINTQIHVFVMYSYVLLFILTKRFSQFFSYLLITDKWLTSVLPGWSG